MSYGFSAVNGSVVTIDQDYSNYTLHSVVTVVCDINNYYSGVYVGEGLLGAINVPNVQGVIAFTDSTNAVSTWNSLSNVGGVSYIVVNPPMVWNGSYYDYPPTVSVNIGFYVPSATVVAPLVRFGYGLNIFKPDGTPAFSTNLKYSKHKVTYTINTDVTLTSFPFPASTVQPIFCLAPFVAQGSYLSQPEGVPSSSGESMFWGYISTIGSTKYMNVYSTGSDHMSLPNLTAMFIWQANAHIYLGDY
jgi:hypothetical protein